MPKEAVASIVRIFAIDVYLRFRTLTIVTKVVLTLPLIPSAHPMQQMNADRMASLTLSTFISGP